jgi:hypothetical protein
MIEQMDYADWLGKYPNAAAARMLRGPELAADAKRVSRLLAADQSPAERGALIAVRDMIAYARLALLPSMIESSP